MFVIERTHGMKGMTEQLTDILDESVITVERNTDRIMKEAAVESVELLHAKSPKKLRNGGRYAAGWTYDASGTAGLVSATGKAKGYMVYNATDYQLTHLLENGHALWNGTRKVSARKHIAPVEKAEIAKILSQINNVAD